MKIKKSLLFFLLVFTFPIHGENNINSHPGGKESATGGESISGNPAAVNVEIGSGALGEKLGFKKESGIRIGGVWVGDINYLITGVCTTAFMEWK